MSCTPREGGGKSVSVAIWATVAFPAPLPGARVFVCERVVGRAAPHAASGPHALRGRHGVFGGVPPFPRPRGSGSRSRLRPPTGRARARLGVPYAGRVRGDPRPSPSSRAHARGRRGTRTRSTCPRSPALASVGPAPSRDPEPASEGRTRSYRSQRPRRPSSPRHSPRASASSSPAW